MTSMSRRHLIFAATGIAAAAIAPRTVFAQAATPAAGNAPFILPPLTYPVTAFEPHIDARTMERRAHVDTHVFTHAFTDVFAYAVHGGGGWVVGAGFRRKACMCRCC